MRLPKWISWFGFSLVCFLKTLSNSYAEDVKLTPEEFEHLKNSISSELVGKLRDQTYYRWNSELRAGIFPRQEKWLFPILEEFFDVAENVTNVPHAIIQEGEAGNVLIIPTENVYENAYNIAPDFLAFIMPNYAEQGTLKQRIIELKNDFPVCWVYAGVWPPNIANGLVLIDTKHELEDIQRCLASELLKLYGIVGVFGEQVGSARSVGSRYKNWTPFDLKIMQSLYNENVTTDMTWSRLKDLLVDER